MTFKDLQDRENHFIENCERQFGKLTFEAKQLLRYGYSRGAVLEALGAAPIKGTSLP